MSSLLNRKRARQLATSVRTVLEPLEMRLLMHEGTHDGELPPVTLPFILDFDEEVVGIADTDGEEFGFHQVQLNENGTEYQPGLLDLDVNAGLLNITTSGTSSTGSNSGTDNTLVNGAETIFDATTGAFSITARLKGPIDFI